MFFLSIIGYRSTDVSCYWRLDFFAKVLWGIQSEYDGRRKVSSCLEYVESRSSLFSVILFFFKYLLFIEGWLYFEIYLEVDLVPGSIGCKLGLYLDSKGLICVLEVK